MKELGIGIGLIFLLSMAGCTSQRPAQSPAILQQAKNHQKIAVVPFQVHFSPMYLEDLYRRRKRDVSFDQFVWEHERTAGLELQATFYKEVAKRVQKGRMNILCLDFLQTNRLLADNGIAMIDLARTPKELIARALGVDAVIFGETTIDMDRRTMGWGGVDSKMDVFDVNTGMILFRDESVERFNRPMDTPAYLANNTVTALARRLPY